MRIYADQLKPCTPLPLIGHHPLQVYSVHKLDV